MAKIYQTPIEKLKAQLLVVEAKIHNLNVKANELDSRMQDSWGSDNGANKIWGKIAHCDNQIEELNKKKSRLKSKLVNLEVNP